MSEPMEDHVDEGHRTGTADGTATLADDVRGMASSRGGRPGAATALDVDGAKIVSFEFDADDVLREHAARHPVIIQVHRGRVEFELPDRTETLAPGAMLHLTPMLRHAVRALEPTTLTVTMLLPRD